FSPYPGSQLFTDLVARGRIQFNQEYFLALLAYTDPEHSVSYCDLLGSRALSVLCLATMAYFYCVSFIFRPARAIRFVRALLGRANATKLGTALATRRRKQLAHALTAEGSVDTVILPKPISNPD